MLSDNNNSTEESVNETGSAVVASSGCIISGYKALEAGDTAHIRPYYFMRPNKSCDSAPLCQLVYSHDYGVTFFEKPGEDGCLILKFSDGSGQYGFIPYCREELVPFYFRQQEEYFNKVLGCPLVIYSADEEGVSLLEKAGMLKAYEVSEVPDIRDYLYEAEALKTLAGRRFSAKRNHINRFLKTYEGRWEYRSLSYDDHKELLAFLNVWMRNKLSDGAEVGISEAKEEFDTSEELQGEYLGIKYIVTDRSIYGHIKIGGIFIDGKLRAFSIGDYNEREKMAIVDSEKADPDIRGLYQMINREFLLHEYPDAVLVNREDDVGIEGLRKAKLSYYPCGYEKKYIIRQLADG